MIFASNFIAFSNTNLRISIYFLLISNFYFPKMYQLHTIYLDPPKNKTCFYLFNKWKDLKY